jgi:hypothetical protein
MPDVMRDGAPAPPPAAFEVDTWLLRRTGRELSAIGDGIAADAATDTTVLTAVADGNDGWRAAGAAGDAAAHWREMLRGCAGQIDDLGDRFLAAAAAYRECDDRAAAVGRGGCPMVPG